MYLINSCLICGSDNVSFEPAFLAPFILSRIEKKKRFLVRPISSIRCNDCKFFSSSVRFTNDEMFLIYDNYRGYNYNQLRLEIEGPRYNSYIGKFTSPEHIEQRMQGINSIINRSINIENIKTVLDYGGGAGHFIPSSFKYAEKFVYDIDESNLCPGIKKFNLNKEIEIDYIQCCHVLEHVSEPISFMKELIKFANTETLIYIEVPNNGDTKPNRTWHEHINIFIKESLEHLMKVLDLEIIDSHTDNNCIGFLTKKART